MENITLYDRLGITPDATAEEIRRAYRYLVLHLHPDTNVNKGDTELFIDIQQAYERLSDPQKKAEYDQLLAPESKISSPLSLISTSSLPSIQRLTEPQLFYTLLELSMHPDADLWVPSTPLNISLVVDCSTSMQGHRLDAVKSTSIELLRKLQPNDIFSLIKFDDFPELLIAAGKMTDLKSAEMKIQLLQAGGGTEIFKGLEMGYAQINQFRTSQRINHIVLITDGRTYGDEISCENLADECATFGIGISALGIGTEWNDKFLDKITSKTGGICKYIQNSGAIRETILEEITRIGSCLTEQINYNLQIPQYVEISSVYRLQPDASPLQQVSPINLGNMPHQGMMSIIFEFVIKEIPSDVESLILSKGFVNFEIPRHTVKTKFANRLIIETKVTSEPVKVFPPASILNAVTLLSLYHMQERAREEMAKGEFNNATRYMENMATHLLQKGERDLAQSILNEAAHIRNSQNFSEDGEKRIKYGTRSLLLPAETK